MRDNILKAYILEELILTINRMGFSDSLWMVGRDELADSGHTGRDEIKLFFLYKENEKVLPSDGFVSGCRFDGEFMDAFLDGMKKKSIPQIRYDRLEVELHRLSLGVYYENMYVPATIYISPERRDSIVPTKMNMELPVHEETVTVLCYPIEQEAALHFFIIIKDLELINEMEHYYYLYKIFSENTIDGVRFQNALSALLTENNISVNDDRWHLLMSYRTYSYMKNKWRNWIKRQKELSLKWEEVFEILDIAVSPVRNAILEGSVFFGDWMPKLKRYLE